MNYYKRHVGDCLKDASHLTLTEHGAYVRLGGLVLHPRGRASSR